MSSMKLLVDLIVTPISFVIIGITLLVVAIWMLAKKKSKSKSLIFIAVGIILIISGSYWGYRFNKK